MPRALSELDDRWSRLLSSGDRPVLLGLAPMGNAEAEEIRLAVNDWTPGSHGLCRGLEVYPAVIATWMAGTAAVAYTHGAFYPHFATALGYPGALSAPLERQHLLDVFRRMVAKLGFPIWKPTGDGGFRLVSEFLFHAGFPICHSQRLADALRTIERDGELPDQNEPGAPERLSELLLDRLLAYPIPTVHRALASSAGPLVAQAALDVLITGEFARLNPELGGALRKAFDNQRVSTTGPRLRPPYLRLNSTLSDYEIVLPVQPFELVTRSQFRWQINSRVVGTSPEEELVHPCEGLEQVEVIAAGVRSGTALQRKWELNELRAPDEALHVFDATSRRYRRTLSLADSDPEIPTGEYWIVAPAGWTSEESDHEQALEAGTVSHVVLRPGRHATFDSLEGNQISFSARRISTLLAESSAPSPITVDGERILLGDSLVIEAWFPGEPNRSELLLQANGEERRFIPAGIVAESGWTSFRTDCSKMLRDLPPALHRLKVELTRNGRKEAHNSFWVWAGCSRAGADGSFDLKRAPANLVQSRCQGFDFGESRIGIAAEQRLHRILAFRLGDLEHRFRWRNDGMFIEAVRRFPNRPATVDSIPLGTTVVAAPETNSWVRVWFSGSVPPRFQVCGTDENRRIGGQGLVEFSLADLAVRYPRGGEIVAYEGTKVIKVVSFVSPLRPRDVKGDSEEGYRGLKFTFGDSIQKVRPTCLNLLSGDVSTFAESHFGSAGFAFFRDQAKGIPQIEIQDLALLDAKVHGGVGLYVPIGGWPDGIWVVRLEAAQNENSPCEPVESPHGAPAAVLIATEPKSGASEIHRLAWKAWRQTLAGGGGGWFEWAWNLDSLRAASAFVESAQSWVNSNRPEFGWISLIEKAAAAEAERLLRHGNVEAGRVLLEFANSPSGQKRLIRVPEVMALPSDVYRGLDNENPALKALSICGDIGELDWLAQDIVEFPDRLSGDFLGCFSNYHEFKNVGFRDDEDLTRFDVGRFWRGLGSLTDTDFFDLSAKEDLLSGSHWSAALSECRRNLSARSSEPELGIINGCANRATELVNWLRTATHHLHLIPSAAWNSFCPAIQARTNLEETMPRLCSAFALGSRSAALRSPDGAPRVSIAAALDRLRGPLQEQTFRSGLKAMLEIAPQMLGFFLLFWQAIINTSPHHE